MTTRFVAALNREAERIGADPADLATVISYETAGSFDARKRGPTTQWGQHIGLIQMGEPQRARFNYDPEGPVEDQMRAVGDYLIGSGFKPGMGLLDLYSTINAGAPGRYDASDANNGGAPGTVRDKVESQMAGHREKALALLGGTYFPAPSSYVNAGDGPALDPSAYVDVAAPTPSDIPEESRPLPYSSWVDEVTASYSSTITAAALRHISSDMIDPDFSLPEERAVELLKPLPENYHPMILGSTSESDLQRNMKWVEEDIERQGRLGEGGWSATAAGLLTGLTDPIPLALGVASGGLGVGAMGGMGVAGRLASGAAIGALENATFEGVSKYAFNDPHADPLMGALFGAGFGALGGVLARNPATAREAEMAFDAAARAVRREAVTIAPELDSIGAARNTDRRDPLISETAAYDTEVFDAPTGYGGVLRQDVTGQMTTASNPLVRTIGAHLFEETAGFKDRSVVPDSVNSRATALQRVVQGRLNTAYNPAKSAYVREKGLGQGKARLRIFETAKAADEFNRLVSEYVRSPIPPEDTNPHVARAGDAIRETYATFARELKDAGISDVEINRNYLPLVADHARIAEVDRIVPEATMHSFISKAIREAAPTISEEVLERMSVGYWRNIRKAAYGIEDPMSQALQLGDKDGFMRAFEDALNTRGVLTADQMDEAWEALTGLVDATKKSSGDRPSKGISALKKRTVLDHMYEATVLTADGTPMRLRVADLFQQDAEMLTRRYVRNMSGRVAFAKTRIENPSKPGYYIADGIRGEGDLAKLKAAVASSYRGSNPKEMENALENIDFAWKRINGIPYWDTNGSFAQWSRRLKQAQFIRLMSNMGLNQVQESVKQLVLLGARASFSQLPSVRLMVRGVENGDFGKDALLKELVHATGIGAEGDWGRLALRVDDDRLGAAESSGWTRKLDNTLDALQSTTSVLSGMRALHNYQSVWATKAITQRLYDVAGKVEKRGWDAVMRGKEADRLASMGLGRKDAEALFATLRQHGKAEKGVLKSIGMDAWEPSDVSKFQVFVGRYVDRRECPIFCV